MKRKIFALFLAAVMALAIAACAPSNRPEPNPSLGSMPAAVTTAPGNAGESQKETGESGQVASHYPVTLDVYNYAGDLVSYTFEKAPVKTLVYGRNNVEILLALGLGDHIHMVADCTRVKPEYEEAFKKIKQSPDLYYFVQDFALSQGPDMIIAWHSQFAPKDRMGDLDFWHQRHVGTYIGINSVLSDNESLGKEYQDIRNLAKIYDREPEAEAIIRDIQALV